MDVTDWDSNYGESTYTLYVTEKTYLRFLN